MTATHDAISERFDQSQRQFQHEFGDFCTGVSVITALDQNEPTGPEEASITIARAPLRVSLGGGGTDLPSFADRYGGLVISPAVTRYMSGNIFPPFFHSGIRGTRE